MNNTAHLIEEFQKRVQPWMMACFGAAIAADKVERNHRFFEEATEAVQANGMTRSEAHQLVDYTFDRPVGELHQEIGGVMVTLAALCLASGEDMHAAGETELARIWTKVEQIRAKQAAKPKHSPLPAAATPDLATASETLRDAVLAGNPLAVGMVMGLRSLVKQSHVQIATGEAKPVLPHDAWKAPFEERHQFDVYPEHFMTGMKNEFCAGWHAALKAVPPAVVHAANIRERGEKGGLSEATVQGMINSSSHAERVRADVSNDTERRVDAMRAQTEIARLNAIINTPHADDFIRAVSIEAEHQRQRQRWGVEGDAGKTPADWFWLVGYLAGKALHSHAAGNTEKGEHHIITTAAACANWHRSMFGNTDMRPGVAPKGDGND